MSTTKPLAGLVHGPGTLTLRDHFATIALREIIAQRLNETAERKAIEAYQIADSMMRQRELARTGLPGRVPASLQLQYRSRS